MPDFGEPVNALMVSLPAPGGLNALHLREGRLPALERADEVVVSTPFAEAHGLHPGGRFHVILNGRRQALTVAGTALSPEFIQQMRPGSAFPDSKRYGVMWMERRALGQAYDLEGAFNDLAIGLAPGASAAAVMAAVDGLLERYGVPRRSYYRWCGPNAGGYVLDARDWAARHELRLVKTVQYTKESTC